MKFIYNIVQILLEDKSNEFTINTRKVHYGYFSSLFEAARFIRKHNKEKNCFFVIDEWVLDPNHKGQGETELDTYIYDSTGELLGKCCARKFNLVFHEFKGEDKTYFKGRLPETFVGHKGEYIWCYYPSLDKLKKQKILETPLTPEDIAKLNYKELEYWEDSYMVETGESHDHVISYYCFSDKFIQDIM